jgi:hypothetical protein
MSIIRSSGCSQQLLQPTSLSADFNITTALVPGSSTICDLVLHLASNTWTVQSWACGVGDDWPTDR